MNNFIRKWFIVAFFNLLLVALLGMIMRYKLAFPLPAIDQKHTLHSHSHFAFTGWITQTLMVLLVHYMAQIRNEYCLKKYSWLLYSNLVCSYGMLIFFFFQGYSFFSILFSTLSLIVSYTFSIIYWRDLNKVKDPNIGHKWIKASFIFAAISSLGAYSLAYMMSNQVVNQRLYLAAIYFFLHFQYNGWFFFAGLGLFFSKLKNAGTDNLKRKIFWLFAVPCIPTFLLSALWIPFPDWVYWILIVCVLAQLAAWVLMLKYLRINRQYLSSMVKTGKTLFILAGIAFTIKLLLQSGSVHPELSKLSYSFRPIVIGYLHLVLLAVTSVFLLGYISAFRIIETGKRFKTGVFIFVTGIILNELLLMIQGVASMTYTATPFMNYLLFFAALTMFIGIFIILLSRISDRNHSSTLDNPPY